MDVRQLLTLIIIGTLSFSCAKKRATQQAEIRKQALAQVGSHTITAGEFIDKLNSLSPYIRARYQSPEARREFLDRMIEFELLVQEAKRLGLDKSPESQALLKKLSVEAMIEDAIKKNVKMSDVTEEEVKAYYNSHEGEFFKPEQVRLAHILTHDKRAAERILPEVLQAAHDQDKFEDLVRKYSFDEATRLHEGDLNYVSKPDPKTGQSETTGVPIALIRAAFTLKEPGDIYPEPIETAQGFHIIRLTGRHMPLKLTLEEAEAAIRNRIWRERRDAFKASFIAEIQNKAKMKTSP